jgi:hypothetical protein
MAAWEACAPSATDLFCCLAANASISSPRSVWMRPGQATTAQSSSGNATPLMMGTIAYVILFIPVVVLGRLLETRFAARPRGPQADHHSLPHRHSVGAWRGTRVRAISLSRSRAYAGRDCGNRLLPRHSAAGALDLRLFRAAVRGFSAVALDDSRHRLFSQHVELFGEI